MALTGAQVKQLRSMAHHLNPAIIIGKSDVNEAPSSRRLLPGEARGR